MNREFEELILPETAHPLSRRRRKQCIYARRFKLRRWSMICGPILVLSIPAFIATLAGLFSPWSVVAIVIVSIAWLTGFIGNVLTWQKIGAGIEMRSYYRDGRPWFCAKCGYPFKCAALADNRCPECGEAFERRPKGSQHAR